MHFLLEISLIPNVFHLFADQTDSNISETGPLHTEAGSDGLTNLGLFADRRAAYRMIATEGMYACGNIENLLHIFHLWFVKKKQQQKKSKQTGRNLLFP